MSYATLEETRESAREALSWSSYKKWVEQKCEKCGEVFMREKGKDYICPVCKYDEQKVGEIQMEIERGN